MYIHKVIPKIPLIQSVKTTYNHHKDTPTTLKKVSSFRTTAEQKILTERKKERVCLQTKRKVSVYKDVVIFLYYELKFQIFLPAKISSLKVIERSKFDSIHCSRDFYEPL